MQPKVALIYLRDISAMKVLCRLYYDSLYLMLVHFESTPTSQILLLFHLKQPHLRSIKFYQFISRVLMKQIAWEIHPALCGLRCIVQDRYLMFLNNLNDELVIITIFEKIFS
jgi:hypothetical protein